MPEASEVGDLCAEPDRGERVDAAQAPQPRDVTRPRRAGDQLGDRRLELVAADHQRVDRAHVVKQRGLRSELAQPDPREPLTVAGGPVPGRAVVAHVVAQQQFAQPVTGSHQIAAHVLTRANQIAQRLLLAGRHPHGVQAVDHQQARQPLSVAAVGFDPVLYGALDLARCRHHTPHPRCPKRPRQTEPGRAGLVGHSRRPRQLGAEAGHRRSVSRQPAHRHLARIAVHHARHDLGCMHVKTSPAANLRHGSTLLPYGVVGDRRGGNPQRVTTHRTPYAREDRPTFATAGRPSSIWSTGAPRPPLPAARTSSAR